MEFGETIPLFYLTLCLLFTTPIVGVIVLLVIRFGLKDRQLTKNILYAIAAVALIWFLFPVAQLAYTAAVICRQCPGLFSRVSLSELVGSTLRFSLGLLIFGVPCGFIVAFFLVLPITLAIRFRKARRTDANAPSA